jgi:undecaprenyl-diphosphatase
MPLYQAIILAIVQGLTEFLPVSSVAHLAVVPRLFGWTDPGLGFDIALHAGTLIAIIVYFFKDWVTIIGNGLGFKMPELRPDENNRFLLWYLAVGSIPVGLAGLFLKKYAEGPWRNLYVIGAMLIIVGIVMALADYIGHERKNIAEMSWADAMIVGLSQALAVVPGTSRSGITISAGRFRDVTRESAARFSFLLSTPAITAAALQDVRELVHSGGIPPEMRLPYLAGVLVSALVGLVVIAFFLKYLRSHTFSVFVWYRVIFGIILLALAFFRLGG